MLAEIKFLLDSPQAGRAPSQSFGCVPRVEPTLPLIPCIQITGHGREAFPQDGDSAPPLVSDPSVSFLQNATSQTFSSLSAGKMTMNKINETLHDGSFRWCLQWGIAQCLSLATWRSPFYRPKMLLLLCGWPLSTGRSGASSPELPHYSVQSMLHPRLQYIIIQMSQPQWRKKYAL